MTKTPSRKITLTGAASLLALSLAAGSAYAQEKDFDIEAQPLAKALLGFNEQSGVTVAAPRDLVADKRSSAVYGEMEPQEALEKILSGSGLQSTELSTGAYTITLASAEVTEPTSAPFRVAGLGQEDGVGRIGRDEDNDADEERVEDTIVVTGTNIRGVENVGAASVTFTRDELATTGFSTLEEVFETLPQNLADIGLGGLFAEGVSTIAAENTQLASGINLRGLGPGSTLVLLNGKRRPLHVNGRIVDVSAIPLSMIERVEVVTGGRSAIYGSDAVAGVVNIVTVNELDGAETQIYYGQASEGAESFNFSQTFGRSFDKGGFVLGYDHRNDGSLDATEAGVL